MQTKLSTFCENLLAFVIMVTLGLAAVAIIGLVAKIYWLCFMAGWKLI